MITYQLEITAHQKTNSGIMKMHLSADAQRARESIEMKHSGKFQWEGDEQESLSRSIAINLAEKEINEYPHLRHYLSYAVEDMGS